MYFVQKKKKKEGIVMQMTPPWVYLSIWAVLDLKDSSYYPILRKYLNIVISTGLLCLACDIIPGPRKNQNVF